MANETLQPEVLFNGMIEFLRAEPSQGVNNFVLEGPVDVPTIFTVTAGLYPPHILGRDSTCVIVTSGPIDKNSFSHYHSRILHLEIPQRVKDLEIPGSNLIRDVLKKKMSLEGRPYIVVAFGTPQGLDEDSVVLACVTGMTPEAALREFQDRSRQRLATYQ